MPSNRETNEPLSEIYGVLSHTFRRNLISYLYRYGYASFTDLKEEYGLGPGTLYYHLGKMKPFIAQDDEKRYILTDKGKMAAVVLSKTEEDVETFQPPSSSDNVLAQLFVIIVPLEPFRNLPLGDQRIYFEIGLIVILQTLLAAYAEMGIIPLFIDQKLYVSPLICVVEVVVSLLITWVGLEAIHALTQTEFKFNPSRELLMMIPYAILPLIFFPVFFIGFVEISELLALTVLLILQLWTLALLGRAIQVSKSIPYDRAIVPALIFGYLTTILGFILSF
ncbi:MAG: hypothetical protein ACFFCQ_00610 [Promethearchaeota archaeon]